MHALNVNRVLPATLASAFTLIFTTAAHACPVCVTDTGHQVRAGIMGPDFGWNLFATLLPFPLLLGMVAFIHFGWPSRRRRERSIVQRKTGHDQH